MTLEQLHRRNEKFQKEASQLAELVPGGNMIEFSSLLTRGAQKVEKLLQKLIATKSERGFYTGLEKMEDELDEMIYMLDRLDEANRSKKITQIDEFLKGAYELLSVYSICCDQLIERKVKSDEFETD